jgi:peroxiredoxin
MRQKYALIILLIIPLFILISSERTLPDIKIKNLKGETVHVRELKNDNKPIVINFWATWCKPCIQELDEIHKKYDTWVQETGVKIVAVSIDDSRNSKKVNPLVKARNWKYDILLDENSDLKRAMNVTNPPHTFLVDANGKIVYEHNGYSLGSEEELYKKIKELTEKK